LKPIAGAAHPLFIADKALLRVLAVIRVEAEGRGDVFFQLLRTLLAASKELGDETSG
jgi:hypothetical protein